MSAGASLNLGAGTSPFSRRMLFWLVTIGVISFLGSIALMVGGGGSDPGARYGGHPDAVSAIGYKAFVRTLERLGMPVVVSGFDSTGKARGGVMIVPEPRLEKWRQQTFVRMLQQAERSIVVLPKWRGRPSRANRRWVGAVGLLPRGRVEAVLRRIAPDARVVRRAGRPGFYPSRFSANPDLPLPQLMRSERLQPLIESPQGMLAGVIIVNGRRVLVVSDPDLFSNHGLGRGANARIAVGLVNTMRPGARGPVVFDTVLQGVEKKPSLVRSLFELPFVVGTVSGIAALLVLLWAGAARFGAPRRVRPVFESGKVTLIENGTRLLRFGGHQREILDRYRRAVLAVVTAAVHAPAGDDKARADWLDRVGGVRGTAERWSDLAAHVDALVRDKNASDRRLVDAARRLKRWKREMIDGS